MDQASRPHLVILGSSLTALAVTRDAANLGLRPLLVDTDNDVAMATRRADVRHLRNATDGEVLEWLKTHAATTPCWLIATSDPWLHFIVRHRAVLEGCFIEILHPRNSVLEMCLDKRTFSEWCGRHGVPVPRQYESAQVMSVTHDAQYPLLLRPHRASGGAIASVPKAVHVRDSAQLIEWIDAFSRAGVTPLVTESLLGRRLTQYSVGAARRGSSLVAFVAIKQRPVPELCAVGSYVQLARQDEVEALARRTLELLDYQGIAELEVLRDEDSGENFVIEVNARPWIQYGLGPASGNDLLRFMIDPPGFDARRTLATGTRWLNMSADLYYCFSRSVGLVRSGRIPFGAYVVSLLRANTFAYHSWSDPGPGLRSLRRLFAMLGTMIR